MELTSKEIKRQARGTLTGHYALPMKAFLFSTLLTAFANFPFQRSLQQHPGNFQIVIFLLASFIISLLSGILTGGVIYIHLNLARKKEAYLIDLFRFFTRRPDRFILTDLRMTGILLLTMLPAIACSIAAYFFAAGFWIALAAFVWIVTLFPLCILSLTYSQIHILLIEQPDMGIPDIFRESKKLMHGYKKKLFWIDLSFIGFGILCIFSLGLGYLWVSPYIFQVNVAFYQNIQKKQAAG